MKKLLLCFLISLCSSISYSQTSSISGSQFVCPGTKYTYKMQIPKASIPNAGLIVHLFVSGGKFVKTNSSSASFDVVGANTFGWADFSFEIIWDDYPAFGQINSGYATLSNITIISMKNSRINGITASPFPINNNIIEIPLGQTGSISIRAYANYSFFPSNQNSTVNDFEWKFGGNTSRSGDTYTIKYGNSDLHNSTLTVTPIGKKCSESIGLPHTITINRSFKDFQITSNQDKICNNNTVSFSLNKTASGMTIEWVAMDKLTLVSGQGSSTATFRSSSSGNGIGKVKAILRSNNLSTTLEKSVWVGIPQQPSSISSGMNPNQTFSSGQTYTLLMHLQNGATNYTWKCFDDRFIISKLPNGNSLGIYLATPTTYNHLPFAISVTPSNLCGNGPELIVWGVVTPNGLRISTENNITSTDDINNDTDMIKSVKIYSMSGVIIYSNNSVDSNFNYKDLNIQSGIYILEKIFDNRNITREKIVISQ